MTRYRWTLLACIVGSAVAQESGWTPDQVNATFCQWGHPRVGVIREKAYIDGGNLWYKPGLNDGTYGSATQDSMPDGLIYTLDFGTSFNFNDNFTEKLETISKTGGIAANNIAPQYWEGTLFADDQQFIAYGGLLQKTDAFELPDADETLKYEKYYDGAEGRQFDEGFTRITLSAENLTRYIAFGGSASVPSAKTGYYFSGLQAPFGGELLAPQGNATTNPTQLARSLITVDMWNQGRETWSNETLPDEIEPRISPELVFVPVGREGVLVAMGGVTASFSSSSRRLNATVLAESQANSPKFLTSIPIYDIATKKWYTQPTVGTPPPHGLAEFCTVLASAADGSSHNIYVYGGTSGLASNEPTSFFDDVYVLSLPTFTWIPVALSPFDPNSGVRSTARAGHKCVKPWEDTMLVLGGYTSQEGSGGLNCLSTLIRGFNLNTLTWEDAYSADEAAHDIFYQVPAPIFTVIGGSAIGGARHEPEDDFSDPELVSIFDRPYPVTQKRWYPYNITTSDSRDPTRPDAPGTGGGGGGSPKWLAPVLGTVLGLVFLSALAIAILLYRRRKYLRSRRESSAAATSEVQHRRILSWVKNGGSTTITSNDGGSAHEGDESDPGYATGSGGGGRHSRVRSTTNVTERSMSPLSHSYSASGEHTHGPVEADPENMLFEMSADSQIAEMSGVEQRTGFSFAKAQATRSGGQGLRHSQSVQSNATGFSEGSEGTMVSPSEEGTGTWGSDGEGGLSPSTPRADSPTEGMREGGGGGSGRLSPGGGVSGGGKRKSAFGECFDEK